MADVARILGRLVVGATLRPALYRYGFAILLSVMALAVTSAVMEISRALFFPLFTLAVVLSSIFGGMKPGFLNVGASVLINLLLAPPVWSLRVASSDDLVRVAIFAVVGCVIAGFIGTAGELQGRLEFERNRLSITLHSIGDAVIATDFAGNVSFMNHIAEEATGWRLDEARGIALEKVFNIVNESSRLTVENPVRKVLAQGRIVGLANHTLLIRKDGTEIPIDDSAAPIRDARGTIVGVVLVFRDITEAKVSQAAMVHAEKLATVGKLASTIAHEINNPLEAVSNLLYLVGEDKTLTDVTKGRVDLAQAELARAAEITKQTLSFHKGESVRTNIRLADIVDSIVRLYYSRAQNRGVEIRNEIAPHVTVHAIASQVRQLVSNFVTNALDAMPNGGVLRITAEVTSNNGLDEVAMKFADSGHGIESAHLKRIFEPFFTTKSDVGTGLGLWVAKRIVEDHDGRISVESKTTENRGTTFTVVLPAIGSGRGVVAND